ncbi:InlB B-repeat-containing protein [Intestinibacillus massiliensis]|nr:InlB B-repeat-containing protein [Intestinibacillus massiliensis]
MKLKRTLAAIISAAMLLSILSTAVFATDNGSEGSAPSVSDSDHSAGTDTGNSVTGNPETGNPETGNPETGNPETGNPETGNPETGNPETGNPETGNPETGNPETGNPETGNPETGNPETGNPETGNPETGNPETGNPETGNPETGNPETGNPETGNPETGNPETGNPETGNPETDKTENTIIDPTQIPKAPPQEVLNYILEDNGPQMSVDMVINKITREGKKLPAGAAVRPGDEIQYKITVTNNGGYTSAVGTFLYVDNGDHKTKQTAGAARIFTRGETETYHETYTVGDRDANKTLTATAESWSLGTFLGSFESIETDVLTKNYVDIRTLENATLYYSFDGGALQEVANPETLNFGSFEGHSVMFFVKPDEGYAVTSVAGTVGNRFDKLENIKVQKLEGNDNPQKTIAEAKDMGCTVGFYYSREGGGWWGIGANRDYLRTELDIKAQPYRLDVNKSITKITREGAPVETATLWPGDQIEYTITVNKPSGDSSDISFTEITLTDDMVGSGIGKLTAPKGVWVYGNTAKFAYKKLPVTLTYTYTVDQKDVNSTIYNSASVKYKYEAKYGSGSFDASVKSEKVEAVVKPAGSITVELHADSGVFGDDHPYATADGKNRLIYTLESGKSLAASFRLATLPEPTRKGKVFDGWRKDGKPDNQGKKWTSDEILKATFDKDVRFHAEWKNGDEPVPGGKTATVSVYHRYGAFSPVVPDPDWSDKEISRDSKDITAQWIESLAKAKKDYAYKGYSVLAIYDNGIHNIVELGKGESLDLTDVKHVSIYLSYKPECKPLPKYALVTFSTDGHGKLQDMDGYQWHLMSDLVERGTSVDVPKPVAKDGYEFSHWAKLETMSVWPYFSIDKHIDKLDTLTVGRNTTTVIYTAHFKKAGGGEPVDKTAEVMLFHKYGDDTPVLEKGFGENGVLTLRQDSDAVTESSIKQFIDDKDFAYSYEGYTVSVQPEGGKIEDRTIPAGGHLDLTGLDGAVITINYSKNSVPPVGDQVTVTFDTNDYGWLDGNNAIVSYPVSKGTMVKVPSTTPVQGYKFSHWEVNDFPVLDGLGEEVEATENITYTAIFVPDGGQGDKVFVKFTTDDNGTLGSGGAAIIAENHGKGDIVNVPTTNANAGFKFSHWGKLVMVEEQETYEKVDLGTTFRAEEDVTYKAFFVEEGTPNPGTRLVTVHHRFQSETDAAQYDALSQYQDTQITVTEGASPVQVMSLAVSAQGFEAVRATAATVSFEDKTEDVTLYYDRLYPYVIRYRNQTLGSDLGEYGTVFYAPLGQTLTYELVTEDVRSADWVNAQQPTGYRAGAPVYITIEAREAAEPNVLLVNYTYDDDNQGGGGGPSGSGSTSNKRPTNNNTPTNDVVINDNETPLAEGPADTGSEVTIDDGSVPLADAPATASGSGAGSKAAKGSGVPATGDNAPISLLAILLVLSGAGIGLVLRRKKG